MKSEVYKFVRSYDSRGNIWMDNINAFAKIGVKVNDQEAIKKVMNTSVTTPVVMQDSIIDIHPCVEEAIMKASLIPRAYRDVLFTEAKVRQNILDQRARAARKFIIMHYTEYMSTLNGIISELRMHNLPDRSYLIGAPNGFGKTSFVNTCIKVMYQDSKACVPYVSLFELAEIRKDEERRLSKGMLVSKNKDNDESQSYYENKQDTYYRKQPELITGDFSWSEYMNSDVLFCYLSSLDSKEIESRTLKTILDTRGTKGLATIVFMSTSLDPYKNDQVLGEYLWDEMLAYQDLPGVYDRVTHVSCYKRPKYSLGTSDNVDIGIDD